MIPARVAISPGHAWSINYLVVSLKKHMWVTYAYRLLRRNDNMGRLVTTKRLLNVQDQGVLLHRSKKGE